MIPDWIAVDWGTTHLRAYAMGADGVLAEGGSPKGMSALAPGDFEAALLEVIGDWLPAGHVTEVLACGMVGARQGWVEAPYRTVPCAPVARDGLCRVATQDARLDLRIVPGLCQTTPAADVMRGEEVQIAGALAARPRFDGVICLPGTHSKWVQVSAGEVVSFQTYMTGELFALLSAQSVLRHSVAATGWDEGAFASAVSETLSRPERLAARLFGLRAEGLLADQAPQTARARLSGLLIGAELAAARPYWLGQAVLLVGSDVTCAPYAAALTAQAVPAEILPAAACTIAGLSKLRGTE